MKKLANLKGAKKLNTSQQQVINGGGGGWSCPRSVIIGWDCSISIRVPVHCQGVIIGYEPCQ